MKVFLFTLCVCAVFVSCKAKPQPQHRPNNVNTITDDEKIDHQLRRETSTWIPILRYNKEQSEDGSYKSEYETGNNIVHEEEGFYKDFSDVNPNGIFAQHGQYSYQSPDGDTISVQYTADERGFRATGDHIPKPPAIPQEIQKGLDQIYAGIKLQQERLDQRAKTDPEFAKRLENQRSATHDGHYVGPLENP